MWTRNKICSWCRRNGWSETLRHIAISFRRPQVNKTPVENCKQKFSNDTLLIETKTRQNAPYNPFSVPKDGKTVPSVVFLCSLSSSPCLKLHSRRSLCWSLVTTMPPFLCMVLFVTSGAGMRNIWFLLLFYWFFSVLVLIDFNILNTSDLQSSDPMLCLHSCRYKILGHNPVNPKYIYLQQRWYECSIIVEYSDGFGSCYLVNIIQMLNKHILIENRYTYIKEYKCPKCWYLSWFFFLVCTLSLWILH